MKIAKLLLPQQKYFQKKQTAKQLFNFIQEKTSTGKTCVRHFF